MPRIERDQREQIGVLPQQREQLAAAGRPARNRSKAASAASGFGRARRNGSSSARHDLRQSCARASRAHAPDSARNASRAPCADTSSGWRKPMLVSVSSVSRIVGFAGEDEAARRRLQRRRVLEQLRVMALHLAQMRRAAPPRRRPRSAYPAEAGEAPSPSWSAGSVCVCSSATICRRARCRAGSDRRRRARRAPRASIHPPSASASSVASVARAAQLGMPAAGDELLGLDEELDLADAAAAELDIVAVDRDLLVAAMGMDLALHRVDVGDRGEIEVLAPDEGRSSPSNASPAAMSPAQGRALISAARSQFWPTALVIVERGGGRDRDLGRRRDRDAAADRCGTRSRRRCAPAGA